MRFTKVATTAAGVGAGLVAALALASPAAASPSGTVGAAASPGPYAVTTPIQPTWYIAFATARQMAATHCTSYGQNVLTFSPLTYAVPGGWVTSAVGICA